MGGFVPLVCVMDIILHHHAVVGFINSAQQCYCQLWLCNRSNNIHSIQGVDCSLDWETVLSEPYGVCVSLLVRWWSSI